MLRFILKKFGDVFKFQPSAAFLAAKFERDRNQLQNEFLKKARKAGIPRGLTWARCDWLPSEILLQDLTTRDICMLVGINVSFEADVGGDMENVAAVGMLRDACAVFQWSGAAWSTNGRVLFNMNPQEASERLQDSYSVYVV